MTYEVDWETIVRFVTSTNKFNANFNINLTMSRQSRLQQVVTKYQYSSNYHQHSFTITGMTSNAELTFLGKAQLHKDIFLAGNNNNEQQDILQQQLTESM